MFFGEKICLHLNRCSDWEWNFLENIFSTCMKTLSGRLMTHVWSSARNHHKDGQSTEISFTPERWSFWSHFSTGVRAGPWRTLFNASHIAKERTLISRVCWGIFFLRWLVLAAVNYELPPYSSDLSFFSVLLVLPLFVVISEDYSLKQVPKGKPLMVFRDREELCTCLSFR